MTRKDYIAIAAIIAEKRWPSANLRMTEDELLNELAHEFADMLAEDNPRFDRGRFLEAAGAIGWKKTLAEEK